MDFHLLMLSTKQPSINAIKISLYEYLGYKRISKCYTFAIFKLMIVIFIHS